jgi:hypothetical protein
MEAQNPAFAKRLLAEVFFYCTLVYFALHASIQG